LLTYKKSPRNPGNVNRYSQPAKSQPVSMPDMIFRCRRLQR